MRAGEWMERGAGPWRDQVRELQLRIRNRFRVAVVRRRHRLVESDYSSPVKRWLHRLRNMWVVNPAPDTPTSSMRFYLKQSLVGKAINDESILVRMVQALAVPVIGNACYVFMHGLNHVQIYGVEKLHQAFKQRPEGKPLLTVSNHVAAVDDPLVIASLLPPSSLLNAHDLRWTLCATDRCFRNPLLSAFFHCLKVLPVSRGDGVYQKGMDSALSKLNNGGWVHIFPEGSRSRDGGRTMAAAKRGVGRLVIDADTTPIVIPFVHAGMQEIMPIGTHFPKIGKNVTVLIGDPLFLDDLVVYKDDSQHVSTGILYDAVSTRIEQQLQELKAQVDRLAAEQELEIRDVDNRDCATRIWQQVDWEAFGMQNILEEPAGTTSRATHNHPIQVLEQSPKSNFSRSIKLVDEGGIVSRIRGFMDPSELMGFAARGLFINGRIMDECASGAAEAPAELQHQCAV
ncbi:hypothetical protein ZIOFF_000672 [Zingiber officinale]|uniref:Tafazzin family protein n=1 Tax=Zingiber officinale TaxID=94328 RepID=A0A8J5LRJ8_ZINOF|nr:hypothetical protein ZIOFF_000672 [Zingiber officinale]